MPISHNGNESLVRRAMHAAVQLAQNDTPVQDQLEKNLIEMPRPIIADPSEVRDDLWSILATPHRHRGIRWLDKVGLLSELISSWDGNESLRSTRLEALEEVHKETWKQGLDQAVVKLITDTHDVVIDGRVDRWALTAFATLLAMGEMEDQRTWTSFIRRDLHALGATEAEIVWVTGILLNITRTLLYLRGEDIDIEMRPEWAVAGLSTLAVTEPDKLESAEQRTNEALHEAVNPLDRVAEEDD